MACISLNSIFDTKTKQMLVDQILSPSGDWESFLRETVPEKTDVIINKINKIINSPEYGGLENLRQLDAEMDLDVAGFQAIIFETIGNNSDDTRRSEKEYDEKPDINISFDPWDAGGKTRVTTEFSHKLTSGILIDSKVANGKTIFFTPIFGSDSEKDYQINKFLTNYKRQLIQTIYNACSIGDRVDWDASITDNAFTQMVEDALIKFENWKASFTESDKDAYRGEFYKAQEQGRTTKYIDANDAYVKLKYFNYFVQDSGFVELKNAYKKTDVHGVNMYSYKTPKMNHVTRWGGEEIRSVDKHSSSAFKLLTNNIPCVNANGDVIPGQYVGEDGFRAIMSQFKLWLRTANDGSNSYNACLENGDLRGLRERVNAFVNQNLNGTVKSKYKVKYPDRLRGLQVLFNSEGMSTYIPLMWSYVLRSEAINYNMYSTTNGNLKKTSAQYRLTRLQSHRLFDSIKGAIYNQMYVYRNYNKLNDPQSLKNRYGITKLDDFSFLMFTGTDHEIKITFEQGSGNSRENRFSIAYIHPNSVGAKQKDKKYIDSDEGVDENQEQGVVKIQPNITGTNRAIIPFIEEHFGTIPSNWGDFTSLTSLANLYTPAIGSLIMTLEQPDLFTWDEYQDGNIKFFNPYKSGVVNATTPLIDFLTASKGSDLTVTLKDLNGNSIPAFGITSFQYNLAAHKYKIDQEANSKKPLGHFNVFSSNFVYKNIGYIGQEIIRNTVSINGTVKSSKELSSNEVSYLAITADFAQSLFDENNKYIEFQNTTNSDKVTHPIIPYGKEIPLTSNLTLEKAVKDIIQGDKTTADAASDAIIRMLWNCRSGEYKAIAKTLLNDYNRAIPNCHYSVDDANLLQSIDSLYAWLQGPDKDIRREFHNAGVQFDENIHSDGTNTNETLFAELRLYCGNNYAKFKERMLQDVAVFAQDLQNSRIVFNIQNKEVVALIKQLPEDQRSKWVDLDTGDLFLFKKQDFGKIEVNPILVAYNLCDALCSSEYNKMTFGMTFAHPVKRKPSLEDFEVYKVNGRPVYADKTSNVLYADVNGYYRAPFDKDVIIDPSAKDAPYRVVLIPTEDYIRTESAARLNASYKRTVIGGATLIPYIPQKYGVGKECVYAAVEDLKAIVWNMMGVEYRNLESMNGSMLASPIFSNLAQVSSTDAAAGEDSKTILGDLSSSYGKPILFKSAEYALTNNRRQLGYLADASVEALFEKMHSIPIGKVIKLEDYYKYTLFNKKDNDTPIYKRNPCTGKHYKISDFKTEVVTINNQNVARLTYKLTEVSNDGISRPGSSVSESRLIRTIYDIDQVFGGAYSEKLVDGQFEYANYNVTYATKIVCEEDLKMKFISYLVNISAEKVGACNVNSPEIFDRNFARLSDGTIDFSKISTSVVSTMGLGVQMDPNHELDFSEVTEMSQMISALIQGGHFTKLVNQIYTEIGKIAAESLKRVEGALEANDDEEIYQILGESLMKSFESGNKSTIGLAQSFVMRARIALKNKNLNYKIPFSAPTINGSFIADVVSKLNSSGIRRKYAGIAAVLVPSHNMIQYYMFNGERKLFNEFYPEFTKAFINQSELEGMTPTAQEAYIKAKYEEMSDENNVRHNPELFTVSETGEITVSNPSLVRVNKNEIGVEDTLVLVEKANLDNREIIKIDSFTNFDNVMSKMDLNDYYCFNWTIKPKNLRQSDTRFTVNGVEHSIYEMDSVRASHYITRLKPNQSLMSLDINEAFIIQRTISKIISKLPDSKKALYELDTISTIDAEETLSADRIKLLKKLIDADTAEQLQSLDTNKTIDYQYGWDSNAPKVLTRKNNTSYNDTISYNQNFEKTQIQCNNVRTRFAEMMLGRLLAKQLGLRKGDSISQILKEGDTFFYKRLISQLSIESLGNKRSEKQNLYDYSILTKTGDVIYVSVRDFHKDDVSNYKLDNKICTMDSNGIWINKETKLCDPIENAKIKTIRNVKGESCPLLIVDSIDDLDDLFDSDTVAVVKTNVNKNNLEEMFKRRFPQEVAKKTPVTLESFERDVSLKVTSKMLNTSDDAQRQDIIDLLNETLENDIAEKYLRLASQQFLAFKQQLYYIGARIPTQSMQSFQALECIGFTEDTTGKVYVPDVQTWLQGSDYDIDKLYIMSFALNADGTMPMFSNLPNKVIIKNLTEVMSLTAPNCVRYHEAPATNLWTTVDQVVTLSSGTKVMGGFNPATNNQQWFLNPSKARVEYNANTNIYYLYGITEDNKKQALNDVSNLLFELNPKGIANLNIKNGIINNTGTIPNDFINRLRIQTPKIQYVTSEDILNVLYTQTSFEKFNDIMESDYDQIKFDPSISEEDKNLFLKWLNIHSRGEYIFYEDPNANDPTIIDIADAKAILNNDYKIIKKYARSRNKAVHVIQSDKTEYTPEEVINKLNDYQRKKHLKVNNREAALQNCNTARMLKLLGKASVQPYGHDPISLDELSDIAKEHTSSIEKRTTMDNAYSKFMMQFQNMVGKDVVGIAAVGMKVFFATSDFVNTEVENIVKSFAEYDDEAVAKHLINILFADTSTGTPQIATLANINFKPLLDLVEKGTVTIDLSSVWDNLSQSLQEALSSFGGDRLDLKSLLEAENGLVAQTSKTNAAMNISQFLSAATDNAKELILNKINGGVEFADMWTYLMMTGHTLPECARIMTSKFFKCTAELSQSNEFDNVSAGVSSKEVLKMLAGQCELHTINTGVFKYLQRGFASHDLNNCFFLKLFYKTDARGRFLTEDATGKLVPLKFDWKDSKGNLEKLREKGIELDFNVEFTQNENGKLSTQKVDKAYIEYIINNQNEDILKSESANWLTSPLACEIFIKHLRGQLTERTSVSELYNSYQRANGNFDDEFDTFDEVSSDFDEDGSDENFDQDYDDNEMESGVDYREDTIGPDDVKEADIRNIIRYVQRYVMPKAELYEKMSQEDFDILQKVIEDIIPATEEQSIVGAILSINQGMKTNLFDFYSKLMRIENFVNKQLRKIPDNTETFDIVQFLKDPVYAKKFIDLLEPLKKFVNPLAIINTVPNFKKMFLIQSDALDLFTRSVQTKLDWNISREIIQDPEGNKAWTKKLTQPLFSALHNGIRDSLIISWLATFQSSINIPAGGYIYLHNDRGDISKYQVPEGNSVPILLNSSETLATFKSLMDKLVFPAIKQMYPDNAFARSLQTTPVKNNLNNTLVVRQRLGINISESDNSAKSTAEYNAIQGDFMKIYNDTKLANDLGIGNISIGDMLYLYNLIVYKDSSSQDSFTRLFERTNVYNLNSLVNRYYTYLSEMDSKALHSDIKYDAENDEYWLFGQDGKLLPIIIKKKDLLARMAICKDAKQILGIEAVYDDNGVYDHFRYLDKWGKVDESKAIVPTRNVNPNDFTMDLPYNADNISISSKKGRGLDSTVDITEYVMPSSRTTMTSIYNALFDLCGLDSDSDESKVWSGNNKELRKKLVEEGIDLSNTREVSRILAAKGFIVKGKIYLNESAIYDGDDPVLFHELAHVICAKMKFSEDETTARSLYYRMVNDTFDRLMEEIKIPGLIKKAENLGFKHPEKAIYFSDFKEELFVDEISRALKYGISETVFKGSGKEISESGLTSEIKTAIKDLLKIDSIDNIPLEVIGNTKPKDCLAILGKYLKPGMLDDAFKTKIDLSGKHKALKQALLDSSDKDFGIDVNCK